jgi:hypothetical protein
VNDDLDKTGVAFEAIVDDAKKRGVIDDEQGYRLKRRFRINSTVSKIAIKIVKSWWTWVIALFSGIGAEITNLINVVD